MRVNFEPPGSYARSQPGTEKMLQSLRCLSCAVIGRNECVQRASFTCAGLSPFHQGHIFPKWWCLFFLKKLTLVCCCSTLSFFVVVALFGHLLRSKKTGARVTVLLVYCAVSCCVASVFVHCVFVFAYVFNSMSRICSATLEVHVICSHLSLFVYKSLAVVYLEASQRTGSFRLLGQSSCEIGETTVGPTFLQNEHWRNRCPVCRNSLYDVYTDGTFKLTKNTCAWFAAGHTKRPQARAPLAHTLRTDTQSLYNVSQ